MSKCLINRRANGGLKRRALDPTLTPAPRVKTLSDHDRQKLDDGLSA